MTNRFDLYGALWLLCSRWHGGQGSRGYKILSQLSRAQYEPGMGLQNGEFETEEQIDLYRHLYREYKDAL